MDSDEEQDASASELLGSNAILVHIFIAIVGLASNVCIVAFTVRKNTRSVLQTYYLMFMATICCELIATICLLIMYRYDVDYHLHSIVLLELLLTADIVELLFLVVLCLVWFFALSGRTFKANFKIVLTAIALIVLAYYATVVIGCVHDHFCMHATNWNIGLYAIVFVLVGFMHSIRCVSSNHHNNNRMAHTNRFILIVASIYMICWLPHTLLCLLYNLTLRKFHHSEFLFSGCIGCLYSFFALAAFLAVYKNWRKRFCSLFRCRASFNGELNDDLSDSGQNVSEITTI